VKNEQPEALRLADALEGGSYLLSVERNSTAAELRRLHAENIELKAKADVAQAGYLAAVQTARWQESTNKELNRHIATKHALRAQRDELLEALKLAEAGLADIGDADREPGDDLAWCERRAAESLPIVRAVLAKAEPTNDAA